MSGVEPGTVAVATVRGVKGVRVMRGAAYDGQSCWHSATLDRLGHNCHHDDEVTDVRPLVVLALPDGAKAGWPVLVDALRHAREKTGYSMIFTGLIDQIEAQTRPPKPPEPTGLGAVVKDREGNLWVHFGNDCWIKSVPNAQLEQRTYADIDAVEILSPGVTP